MCKKEMTGSLELRKKLISCLIWSICTVLFRDLDNKKIGEEVFEMWCWSRMKKKNWSEKLTNEEVLEHTGENRTIYLYFPTSFHLTVTSVS